MAAAQILPGGGGDKTEELKERRDRWVFPLSLLPGGLTREKKPKEKPRLSAVLCAFNKYFLKI